ncbi:hypothetical protein MUK42_31322 [Musa troglodytarum]|uniref:Uncharacterized protein n=1 Tax=Musa troglodytarum TaxID=320322 RepID=A0A9E7JUI0_9LILI|nr:hypothetical protein MUK42_31322 [Musa troglodytarum]
MVGVCGACLGFETCKRYSGRADEEPEMHAVIETVTGSQMLWTREVIPASRACGFLPHPKAPIRSVPSVRFQSYRPSGISSPPSLLQRKDFEREAPIGAEADGTRANSPTLYPLPSRLRFE